MSEETRPRPRAALFLAAAASIAIAAALLVAGRSDLLPWAPGDGDAVPSEANRPTRPVEAPARLVATTRPVAVTAPLGVSGAHVAHVEVQVGDVVAEGDLLFILDTRESLVAEVADAVRRADARAAELDAARARAESRVEKRRALQRRIEAEARAPLQHLARMQRLRERRIVTAADLDRAVAANDRAQREIAAAASETKLLQGDTDPEVEFAQLELDAALAALARTEQRITEGVISSAHAGRVVTVTGAVGDQLDGQLLLELEAPAGRVALVELPADADRNTREGDRVGLVHDGHPPLAGVVTRISGEGAATTAEVRLDVAPAANVPDAGWTAVIEVQR